MYQGIQAGVPAIRIVLKFTEGRDEAFSSKKLKRKWRNGKVTHIQIYCKCRGIEEGPMIECEECKEWFHQDCCDVPQAFFSKSEDLQWTCMDCYEKHM